MSSRPGDRSPSASTSGTTSVKALAVDEDGQVVARSRVPHSVVAPEPDILRHDAKRAWRAGPRKAFEQVTAQLDGGREHAGRGGGGRPWSPR